VAPAAAIADTSTDEGPADTRAVVFDDRSRHVDRRLRARRRLTSPPVSGPATGSDGGRGTPHRRRALTTDMPLQGDYEPSSAEWSRKQVEEFESSNGERGNTMRGMPVIVLTSRGAKTGKIRKTPLMRVEDDGKYAVVASLGGAPKHPVWYYNLKADPRVELQDGPVKQDMVAREVTGDEKARWWDTAVKAYPDYADYQKRTDREIPVFVLEPAS
jgi:deazaflavin-dependent oxidoreductase (nitroreductase family)